MTADFFTIVPDLKSQYHLFVGKYRYMLPRYKDGVCTSALGKAVIPHRTSTLPCLSRSTAVPLQDSISCFFSCLVHQDISTILKVELFEMSLIIFHIVPDKPSSSSPTNCTELSPKYGFFK